MITLSTMKPGDLFQCPMDLCVLTSIIDGKEFTIFDDINLGIASFQREEGKNRIVFLVEKVTFTVGKHSGNPASVKYFNDCFSPWKVICEQKSYWVLFHKDELQFLIKIT